MWDSTSVQLNGDVSLDFDMGSGHSSLVSNLGDVSGALNVAVVGGGGRNDVELNFLGHSMELRCWTLIRVRDAIRST